MRLIELEPEWIYDFNPATESRRRADDTHSVSHHYADSDGAMDAPLPQIEFRQAQGITFLCPACFRKNGGAIGTEQILVWFAGAPIPADIEPKHRWNAAATSFDDLTLTPSINVNNEHWHGFITNGEVTP